MISVVCSSKLVAIHQQKIYNEKQRGVIIIGYGFLKETGALILIERREFDLGSRIIR